LGLAFGAGEDGVGDKDFVDDSGHDNLRTACDRCAAYKAVALLAWCSTKGTRDMPFGQHHKLLAGTKAVACSLPVPSPLKVVRVEVLPLASDCALETQTSLP
jgi:hypothetical protein